MSTQMSPVSILAAARLVAPHNSEEPESKTASQHYDVLTANNPREHASAPTKDALEIGLRAPGPPRVPSPLTQSLGLPGDVSPVIPCAPSNPGRCAVQRAMDGPRPSLARARNYAQRWLENVTRADSEAAAAVGVSVQRQPGLRGPWTIVRALWSLSSRENMDATVPEDNTLLRKALWRAFIADLCAASGVPRHFLLRDSNTLYEMVLLFRWTAVRTMRNDHAPFREDAMPVIEVVIAQDIAAAVAALAAAKRAAEAAAPPVAPPTAPVVSVDKHVNDPAKRQATTAALHEHSESMLDTRSKDSSIRDGRQAQSTNNLTPTQCSHTPSDEQTAEAAPLDDDPTECDPPFDNSDGAHTD